MSKTPPDPEAAALDLIVRMPPAYLVDDAARALNMAATVLTL